MAKTKTSRKTETRPLIGFIGQGFIGKNYADDFENRGYTVIRYALEASYAANKEKIKDCDIIFIAVPTPTTPEGYNANIIRAVLPLTGVGSIVVLKSTILPGLTEKLQKEFEDRIVMHSPEFLSEATAAEDAAHPFMNIVGITEDSPKHRKAAESVLSVLPPAPFKKTVSSSEAELIKYSHNCSGYTQIIFFNLMYDLSLKLGADWKNIEQALKADPFIPNRYSSPLHKTGRGAGGHCFIKDFAAFSDSYSKRVGDELGREVIRSMEEKNIDLLTKSGKDLDLLEGVYGKRARKTK
ncbi:MAG TPA: NAD(P)-binding domain-containing protein [Candidatus Paceibacterota bacterium]